MSAAPSTDVVYLGESMVTAAPPRARAVALVALVALEEDAWGKLRLGPGWTEKGET